MLSIIFVQGTIQALYVKWGTPLLHQVLNKSTMSRIINTTTHIRTREALDGGTMPTFLGATTIMELDHHKILDN